MELLLNYRSKEYSFWFLKGRRNWVEGGLPKWKDEVGDGVAELGEISKWGWGGEGVISPIPKKILHISRHIEAETTI